MIQNKKTRPEYSQQISDPVSLVLKWILLPTAIVCVVVLVWDTDKTYCSSIGVCYKVEIFEKENSLATSIIATSDEYNQLSKMLHNIDSEIHLRYNVDRYG